MGCAHAFHSDVIMTLVYSNNLRLYGCFIRFENKQFDQIADVVTDRKTLKVLEIIVYQHSN